MKSLLLSYVIPGAMVACLISSKLIAGDLTGKIYFEGKAPVMPIIKMSADAACAKMHKTPVRMEDVVLNSNHTLENVFVYVKEGITKKYDPPSTPVILAQEGCQYHPHVFGIMAGQQLEIINDDPTLHNVHAITQINKSFNIAQPLKGMKVTEEFDKPEVMITLKCEVHNWMHAYCGVLSNPFFDVSNNKGTFTIKNLPPGTYTIEAWQEKYGAEDKTITVTDKGATLDFTYNEK
jgi:Polysaccharide lyase family 4, domain II